MHDHPINNYFGQETGSYSILFSGSILQGSGVGLLKLSYFGKTGFIKEMMKINKK